MKNIPGIVQSVVVYGLFISVVILLQELPRWGVSLGNFSYLIQLGVAWPLALWVGFRWSRRSFTRTFPITRFPLRTALTLCIASLGVAILVMSVGFLVSKSNTIENCLAQHSPVSDRLDVFLPVVLVAPWAEEFFFRGLVLRCHLTRYSSNQAIWISAMLFALAHLNLAQAAAALPLGLVYAWLSSRTGSLTPSMISHMTVNFSYTFLMAPLVLALGYDEPSLKALDRMPLSILAIGIATTVVGGFVFWRQIAKLPNGRESVSPP